MDDKPEDAGLFGIGYEEWSALMREIMGDEAWDNALAQCELDMQDATVAASAGLHW